ncbi:MAG: DUF523 domain-containing protein [Myxococcales bacterium]|nr:DUF523 domain-containing protein [Myxococcales bacterium]
MRDRPRVGVSSCLLGHLVRYDGAAKGLPWVQEEIGCAVDLQPICPETGAGMPVPRPPIQVLQHRSGALRVVLVQGEGDVHSPLSAFCESNRSSLEGQELDGYLFKARSPSCGLHDTPYFSESGDTIGQGAGLWARTIIERWPDLPLADESQLRDPAARSDFVRQVQAYWKRDMTRP